MILITKNTTNTAILTLSEKTTIATPVYLFEVLNDQTNISKCFIAQDISNNPERYNEFYIIDNVTELPLVGQVDFGYIGFYKYNIYEQSSTTNLDPLLATNLIDNGKLKVIESVTSLPEYTGNQTTYVVYGG